MLHVRKKGDLNRVPRRLQETHRVAVHSAPAIGAADTTPEDESGYPSPRKAWWAVAVLFFLMILSLLDRQLMSLLVPDIRRDLGISDFQMGLMQGLFFSLFYATFGLLFGFLIDRYSRRMVVFVGVTVWSLATAFCGLATNFTQLMIGRFGVGAGEASLSPAGFSLVGDSFPRRRLALAYSVFGSGGYVGSGVSLLFGGYLIAAIPQGGMDFPVLGHQSVWRSVFLLAGLPGLLIAFLVWTINDPPRRGRVAAQSGTVLDTFRCIQQNWRFYIGHFLGFALMSTMGYGYLIWTPAHLMRTFDIDVRQVVNILAPLAMFGGLMGSLLAGAVVDRLYGRGRSDAHVRFFALAGGVLMPTFLALAMTSVRIELFVVFMFLTQLCSGFGGVSAAALTLTTPNNYRGQVTAVYLLISGLLGAGVGPALVGAFTTYLFQDDTKLGWAIALNGAIAGPLAGLCLALAMSPMRRAVERAKSWAGAP